ncbi:drug/metabolite transporter (DMT)-like permease [Variovorax boronicumulans]|uniref:DMT family transporter n=1 Tax=Variovorax boronicumulans TaxID=436515 RepID=UPI00277EA78A|nr:DMT family transporter [Variovorax boronicumulans]MDQ0033374.1 drug/metabolite transporter (DMT)-like permease [Variovorax boronicumulans]MDQ0042676.1 drug/metabolite transporter (DMT)-like permease [Variovorax boronicumulans]MDQ0072589.1 drug/metabolite transporter (DMT)-like permease [Variovorax boronicumulans]
MSQSPGPGIDSAAGAALANARAAQQTSRSKESERILAGIGLVLVAVACFATLDTATKASTAGVPILMGVWFRYAFQAVATTAVLLPLHGTALLRTQHPRYQLLRGALLLVSSTLAFLSLRYMPLAEFTSIVLIAPLVITLLAATTLKEYVSPLRWALVAGGFIGTLVILRPGGEAFSWAILLPIGLVLTNAWFQVLTSKLAQTENPLTMHFYTGWVGALIASLALPFVWTALPSWEWWALLCLMGFMGTVGHFILILAYQRAPASTLTPYLYAQIAFAMLGGWLVFSQVPDRYSLIGISMIAVCGAAGAWLTVRERRVPIEPAES